MLIAIPAVALALLLAACGSGNGTSGAASTTSSAPVSSAIVTPVSGTASAHGAGTAAGPAAWERIVPGGDCHCADGSEFAFWERRADPSTVVLFLDGGGVCIDATSCAFLPKEPAYDWNVRDEDPGREEGIFDVSRADNPFRGDSFIYVPSCTGDMHLGRATHVYDPGLSVDHNGFANGTAALRHLAEHYPDATQVIVVGKSVGSVAAPVYGGLVADALPNAHVTVLGAQSGHVPDDPALNVEILDDLWGVDATMPDWEVNRGLTAQDWGPRRFWIQAGLHHPEMVLARFDFAFDPEAAQGVEALQQARGLVAGVDPSNLLEVIDANEAAIEAAGVVMHSYTAPGEHHGILEWPSFYEVEVNGVRLVDWVQTLLAGEPAADVHCTDCRGD